MTNHRTLTPLQAAMIKLIAENEMTVINGGKPSDLDDVGQVWVSCVIFSAEDKGVFTSLLNARLVEHGGSGKEAWAGLTNDGFAAYKAL